MTVRLEELLAAADVDALAARAVNLRLAGWERAQAVNALAALARANEERDRLFIDMGEALAKYRSNHRDFLGGSCTCKRCHTCDALLARLDRLGDTA